MRLYIKLEFYLQKFAHCLFIKDLIIFIYFRFWDGNFKNIYLHLFTVFGLTGLYCGKKGYLQGRFEYQDCRIALWQIALTQRNATTRSLIGHYVDQSRSLTMVV